jgi:2-aminoadipate transaminase
LATAEELAADLQWWPDGATIDLAPGQPGPDLLPAAALAEAAADQVGDAARNLLYGSQPGPRRLLREIATLVEASEGYRPELDSLLVTGGTSMALEEICATFSRPGESVAVGDLTYDLALRIFRDHGLEVVKVPGEGAELDLTALSDLLSASDRRVAFVYVIPTFHNPSGACATPRWRTDLADLARSHKTVVVEDDAYRELFFREPPPPSVRSRLNGTTLRLGTFSKTLAPGLRLSWVEGDPVLVERLSQRGMRVSGGGTSHYVASLVARMLESGAYQEHLSALRRELALRAEVVDATLLETKEAGWTYEAPAGGFFFLIGSSRSKDLARTFREVGVRVVPVRKSRSGGGDQVRIAISFADAATLEAALRRAADAITDSPAQEARERGRAC